MYSNNPAVGKNCVSFHRVGRVRLVESAQDYYPFGMLMPSRTFSSDKCRFGFNGKENDNEVKGTGNSLDFGARIYDSRLGRWLSPDPLEEKYPFLNPYNYCANNSIMFIDPSGKVIVPAGKEERKVLRSMINNYFGSDAGFVVKKDKIHYNQKKFEKFMKTCTDPDMIENAKRMKEIVTNENYTTTVFINTSASVINEITTSTTTPISPNGINISVPNPNGITTVRTLRTTSTLLPKEPGNFFYNTAKEKLLPNSGVLINPTQGIDLDTKDVDFSIETKFGLNMNNVWKAYSTSEGTAFHELIGHTYEAYQGNLQKPQGNELDPGVKQENDYNEKNGFPLRSGTDH